MKIIRIKTNSEVLVLSGSDNGRKWAETNLMNINEKILIKTDKNIELIVNSFFIGIFRALDGKKDKRWIKENITFENKEFQRDFLKSIRL